MKKKFTIGIFSLALVLGSVMVPLMAEEADIDSLPVNDVQESIDEITEEVTTETVVDTPEVVEEEAVDAAVDIQTIDVLDNESISPVVEAPVKTPRATTIDDYAGLVAALANAQGDATLVISGGSRIVLNDSLKINTAKVTSLEFVSSDGTEVVFINAKDKKHLETTGNGSLNLTFTNVVLSGNRETGLTGGGIAITSSTGNHIINGLVVRESTAKGWDAGILQYTALNGGSLSVVDATFTGNVIPDRNSASAAIIMVDLANGANASFTNITMDRNETVNQNGAAIGFYNKDGVVTVDGLHISNHKASSMSGGMKYTGYTTSTLTLTNSSFKDNTNIEGTAGALSIKQTAQSNVSITNTTFTNNYAHRGGGAIMLNADGSATTTTLDNVTFENNKGGLIEYNPETGEQTGLPSSGGALNIVQSSGRTTLVIKNSRFLNNTAVTGGAIALSNNNGGITDLTLEDSILSGNISDYHGGAIDFSYGTGENIPGLFTIRNTEITNNTVTGRDTGPGYYEGGYGGGIAITGYKEYPDVLVLDGVTFNNNTSLYPVVWNLNAESSSLLQTSYRNNVTDTTFSQSSHAFLAGYNNAFNGDDVYIDYDGIAYFDLNPETIADLDLENYTEMSHYNLSFKNELILEPITPISANYTFLGWYNESDVLWDFATTNQTETHQYLHAKWERKPEPVATYNVSFDLNGATSAQPDAQALTAGSTVSQPVQPVRDGFTFQGWSTTQDGSVGLWNFATDTTPSSNMTLFAQWKPIATTSYNVSFNLNGGDGIAPASQVIDAGAWVSQPFTVSRNGYTFIGWSQNAQPGSPLWDFKTMTVSSDMVLYAQWQPVTPTQPTTPEKLPSTGYSNGLPIFGLLTIATGLSVLALKRRKNN
ncbi:LPXTG cell wall anchor domain-containing protein [Erysipelothrix sp. HDW6C]|uniref:InlB B-repeat-containing protein n=1 Tax=Erysipelothrix sp. HDW6C TaxID=2714930 RepID=UPI00140C6A83|nr:InlB B-repeat-containing protein [Erysipelothrix sp. HDW6C]QIK70612.1 LPXTG cell wall anchor domain-containing protein [Erysipelothrix sp. HDW6C]